MAAAAEDYSVQFPFLKDKPKQASLEGYLFPDTYELKEQDLAGSLAKSMLSNFSEKLTPELLKEISGQDKTVFEVVTLASLLEKEVRTMADKKTVSGIIYKRLRNGMRLQVDATVLYALDKEGTKVSYDDLWLDSPYNTYRYSGLPPGPICNPGRESLLAAVYPEENEYWYYLSAPDGQTHFSRTLEEHNVKKVKYLNSEQDARYIGRSTARYSEQDARYIGRSTARYNGRQSGILSIPAHY
jgi:UPF0755 protein